MTESVFNCRQQQ